MLYTLLMIFVFRLGTYIPVPGLNASALKQLVDGSNSLFGLLDAFSGGSFGNATIFAMSITPYINSSIILQLLTVAIPALERLAKEGEEGRKVIAKWTRIITIVLAFIQATGMYFGIKGAVKNPGVTSYIVIVATFTAGTAFLMWLGEQITQKGVGNGISLIIFAGIVSRIPTMGYTLYQNVSTGSVAWWAAVLVGIFAGAMIAFVVFITDAERRIPVQYAKRMVGRKMYGGQSTHIPLKVAMAGVIPIIFASCLIYFPAQIAALFNVDWLTMAANAISAGWVNWILTALLIVFFAYFYTSIVFNPEDTAENLQRQGGFIPGIRPGQNTVQYIKDVLHRVTLPGAIFIAAIAVIPSILFYFTNNSLIQAFGGTSILIMIGVALDTMNKIESQLKMYNYDGFFK